MRLILALLSLVVFPAAAQTLQPVASSGGLPWWAWPAIAIAIVAAGFLWLRRKHPVAAETVRKTLSADLAELTAALHRVAAAHESAQIVPAAPGVWSVVDHAPAQAETVTAPAPPPSPPGKAGQAGEFTTTVTGDPKVDVPALTAQYFQP